MCSWFQLALFDSGGAITECSVPHMWLRACCSAHVAVSKRSVSFGFKNRFRCFQRASVKWMLVRLVFNDGLLLLYDACDFDFFDSAALDVCSAQCTSAQPHNQLCLPCATLRETCLSCRYSHVVSFTSLLSCLRRFRCLDILKSAGQSNEHV
jgi:hypothetical protein